MSMEYEMKIVQLEMENTSLRRNLTMIRNAIRSAQIEMMDDCYEEAKAILADLLPEEEEED